MKCETCEELREEQKTVFISEIRIQGAGYYHWHREIKFCPTCGRRIIKESGKGKNESV